MKESFFDSIICKLEPFKFIDVGAMSIIDEPYQPLMERTVGSVLGFEPQKEECEKLQTQYSENSDRYIFLPFAVGDGSERTFYECNFTMTSSLYRPNKRLVSEFHNLGNIMEVVREQPIKTVRLDDVKEAYNSDYLKLDAQGGELDILQHGRNVLKSVLMIHTEVEFVPLYENQPLFADIDAELRHNGFMFHRFEGLSGRPYKPLRYKGNANLPISQTLWSDAIYVRNITKLEDIPTHRILKLAVMLDILYESFDLSAWLLKAFDQRSGFRLQEAYLDYLVSVNAGSLVCEQI